MKLANRIVLTVLALSAALSVGFGCFLIAWNFDARLEAEVRAALSGDAMVRNSVRFQLSEDAGGYSEKNIYYAYLLRVRCGDLLEGKDSALSQGFPVSRGEQGRARYWPRRRNEVHTEALPRAEHIRVRLDPVRRL